MINKEDFTKVNAYKNNLLPMIISKAAAFLEHDKKYKHLLSKNLDNEFRYELSHYMYAKNKQNYNITINQPNCRVINNSANESNTYSEFDGFTKCSLTSMPFIKKAVKSTIKDNIQEKHLQKVVFNLLVDKKNNNINHWLAKAVNDMLKTFTVHNLYQRGFKTIKILNGKCICGFYRN